jgi:hypothetical protein
MTITIVCCFYIFDEESLSKFIQCIESIDPFYSNIYFLGHYDPQLFPHPAQFPFTNLINLVLYDTNVGKSRMLNDFTKSFPWDKSPPTSILYLDGDINVQFSVRDHTCMLSHIVDEMCDVLVFDQKEDCRHAKFDDNDKGVGHLRLRLPSSRDDKSVCDLYQINSSLGGGCFLSKSAIFRKVVHKEFGEYGPDDYYMFRSLVQMGAKFAFTDTYFVIHPFTANKTYRKHKYKTLLKYYDEIMCDEI